LKRKNNLVKDEKTIILRLGDELASNALSLMTYTGINNPESLLRYCIRRVYNHERELHLERDLAVNLLLRKQRELENMREVVTQ